VQLKGVGMLSFNNIWTIAKYETKTLLRSWFFRIFSGLSLIVLVFMNIVFFAEAFETMPWSFRGIPASVPYFSMMLLNLAQAIIAIFLASDFIKRDRKSNTTEVIYMRSMSNADYILGKSFGLFSVFLGLNIVLLIIAAVINIVFADTPFQFLPYLYYLSLISIPTLIFIFGLSFFVMSIIGNQAITFLLLLGYFAISLVALNFKFQSAFDGVGFFMPLAYSDFVGFSDLPALLMQRLSYLSTGIGLIFVSVLLFKRLPQSKAMQGISRVFAVGFIGIGAVLFTTYLLDARSGTSLRTEMKELNDSFAAKSVGMISNYDITLKHEGDHITAEALIDVTNDGNGDLSEFIFTLNPGLEITSTTIDDAPVQSERSVHLLIVKPGTPLEPGQSAELKIQYQGAINEDACYIAATDEERNSINQVMMYKVGKKSAFLSSRYLMLTPEAGWYPIPGVGHGTGLINPRLQQFSNYTLRVNAAENLTIISQGVESKENDLVVFTSETPLPQISLVIGPYEKRSIVVDSVTYNLYTYSKHRYFEEYTTALSDTLEPLIRELKNDYELKTKVDYPFASFSMIETPIHFKPLSTPLGNKKEFVQPMQVFLPENGIYIQAADFKSNIKRSQDRLEDRNQSMSETEVQYQVLRRFVETTFLGSTSFRRFGGPQMTLEQGTFSIFPNFYNFVNSIQSAELPIFNLAVAAYLKGKVESSPMGFMRFREAITDEERACLELRENSLQQILADPEKHEIANSLIAAKSGYLFRLIESKVGAEKFEQFLNQTRIKNQFKAISANVFISDLQSELGISMSEELDAWFNEIAVPGFLFTNFKNYKVFDGDRQRFQVIFTIYNTEDVDGVVVVDFLIPGGSGGRGQRGGFGRFNMGVSDYERAIHIPAGAAKQIAIVTDDQPRAVTINTLVSKNLPSKTVHRFEEFEENNKAKPLDYERLLDEAPELVFPGEYIVDNEDEGFKVLTAAKRTPLQRLFKITEEEEEYKPFSPWRTPQNWSKTINSLFYGELVHSAHFIRGSDGANKVAWEADLPQGGQYSVYAYAEKLPMRGRGGSRGGFVKDFHYSIYHDDGVEEVEWSADSAEGWNFLGSFYFSAGVNKVELSNESKGRLITADAIKWVKK
jgi:ABC-type transport system involved in multi-copper enzyme maturation permease subunit